LLRRRKRSVRKSNPKDCDAIEYLKYKSLVVGHNISDKVLRKIDIKDEIVSGFVTLQPLIKYINEAIDMEEN
jgi:uncharacterized protein (DUF2461 family)